jgi:hypothetical protein
MRPGDIVDPNGRELARHQGILLQLGSPLVISIEPSHLRVRPLSSVDEYLRIIISIPC